MPVREDRENLAYGVFFTLRKVLMTRSISSSGATRNPVFEVLGMNYSHLRGSAMGELDLISRPN